MDLTAYISDIKIARVKLAEQFPSGACLLVSLANRDRNTTAGMICEVTTDHAARLTVENTHRLATEAEVAAYRKLQDAERTRIASDELTRARRQFNAMLGGNVGGIQPVDVPVELGKK